MVDKMVYQRTAFVEVDRDWGSPSSPSKRCSTQLTVNAWNVFATRVNDCDENGEMGVSKSHTKQASLRIRHVKPAEFRQCLSVHIKIPFLYNI